MTLAEKYGKKKVFIAFDYSQLEIRVLAQMSGDKMLLQMLESGKDIHALVGAELTGLPFDKIRKDRETRTAIKGIHFGIIYGLSPHSLYMDLKIRASEHNEKFEMSENEVTRLYNLYFKRFRTVKRFIDGLVQFGKENQYVETLFGFKREISTGGEEGRETFWGNQAVNTPIQGSAHQLLMFSLAILEKKKQTYNLLQDLCMEVHDSLVAFSLLENLPETYHQGIGLLEEEVLLYMKRHWPDLEWRVPLKAEAKAGFRLGVLVEDYKGEPPDEFIEKWCVKNKEFEKKLQKEMQEDA